MCARFEGENERMWRENGPERCKDGGRAAVYQTMPTRPRQSLGTVDWLFDVRLDGVAPDEVALAHEV